MRILVIDDDASLIRVVSQYLEPDGYVVLGAQDAYEGLQLVQSWHPDLIFLDIVMPGIDGRQLCMRIRHISQAPIIFLTGLDSDLDIVRGFGAGADEYLTKPPRNQELRARVRAFFRQPSLSSPARQYYNDGYLTVDIAARYVQKQGSRIDLSPLGYKLLACLIARPGELVPHQELIEAVWGQAHNKNTALLHLYIAYLRRKIEQDPTQPRYILNQFGSGYLFAPMPQPNEQVSSPCG